MDNEARFCPENRSGSSPPLDQAPVQPALAALLRPWLRGRQRSLLRRLVNRVARNDVLSLGGGLPAVDLFPAETYGEKLLELLADPRSVQYGPPSGELKEQIAFLMQRRGVACRPEEILVTAGAQQALQVAVAALVAPGDCVALERFAYTGIREALAPDAPRLLTLPSSLDDGLDVEALERRLLAGERPRLLYVIPDAHNPLGVSLTRAKRERLVELAEDYDFAILEDDAYGLLCCDGEFEPPLAALDSERVIHAGTFSKILAPALRLGWLRLPPPLVDTFAAVKEAGDLECSRLTMLAVARLLADLDLERHLELLRSTYRRRRDTLLEALADRMPDGCAFTEPAGGLFVWLELPPETDAEELLERALVEHGVAFVPSAAFTDPDDRGAPANAARLSFSTLEPEELRCAVAKLSACLDRSPGNTGRRNLRMTNTDVLTPTGAGLPEAGAAGDRDFCPILGFDHLELYVGNAKQSAAYYCHAFGFECTAVRGLETGERERASYLVEQGDIRLLLTTGLHSSHDAARSVSRHGDSVAVIALSVPDAAAAFDAAVWRGACAAATPATAADERGEFRHASIRLYGDCVLQFIERRGYGGVFGPGFLPAPPVPGAAASARDCGLVAVDHVVANVELGRMNKWAAFFSQVLGFRQLLHFDDEAISTEYSALMSKVMQDGTGAIKFPINEPAEGRRKSQIEEFLEFHEGPGVQHVACRTEDILDTVTRLRANGVEFLRVPAAYYEDLEQRVGRIDEPIDRLAELGILADRDEDGYLLQIFTKPVEDRPTLFYEIIERHGATGFGAGNFKSLFVALEREQAARGNL